MSFLKKIWRLGWRGAVCLLLLAWIFHTIFLNEGRLVQQAHGLPWEKLSRIEQWKIGWSIGPQELWRTLSQIHPKALVLSVILVGFTVLLGVLRWQIALRVQGLNLPLRRATAISFVAQFFNSFLLGSTGGDLIKAYYAARETHHKKTEAVVTVFIDRLIGLWAMLIFAGVMMLPNYTLIFKHANLRQWTLIVLAMLIGCTVVLGLAFWGGLSQRWPGARNFLRKLPKGQTLEKSLDSCRQFGQHRLFLLQTLSISFVINALCVLQVMILARGLNLEIPPLALFVIVPIVICISALPITLSGLGVREYLFVLMLASPEINVPKTAALSISLLAFAGSLFWSVVGGIVYLNLREKEHLEEITEDTDLPETE